jgi:hypothetical protein
MQTRAYPSCCGATVLTHFGELVGTGYDNQEKYSPEQVKQFLEKEEANQKRYRNCILTVILNCTQNKKFKKVFKECGWRCVTKAYHSKHNSKLHLYVKVLKFNKPVWARAYAH